MKMFYSSLFLLLSILLSHAEDFRIWNTIDGGYFEAKLTATSNTAMTLKNHEGRVINFSISDLMPSDQKYARDWQNQSGKTGQASTETAANRSDFTTRVFDDLVVAKGKRLVDFEPEEGAQPKYFAFYRSASWCPPCRKFTPDLVDFYKKQKRRGTAFELVFVSSDRSEDLMAEYMNDYDMDWPAFQYGKNKNIVKRNGTGIPNLIITDADGNKLLDSYDDAGNYIGPKVVLKAFETLLKKTL